MKTLLKHVVCLLFLLFACSFAIHAQVRGKVVDETGNAVPAATVRILTLDSVFVKGVVTDNDGNYKLDKIEPQVYILAVSYIGYENMSRKIEISGREQDLSVDTLKNDNVHLDEVTVVGSSFVRKKDHLLVIPDRKQIKHSFSGYDLLYNLMIPGLTIDRKNKTVTALTGTATLYINGVEADIKEVQNLRPKDIEKIEFYTLPSSGPFMGDAASVNYITKVRQTGGYVTVDGTQQFSYLNGEYNVATKISHGKTCYSVFGGYSMKEHDGYKNTQTEHLLLPDGNINRNTTNKGADYRNSQQYVQFKIANNTEKHDLSASASFVRDDTPHDDREELLQYDGGNADDRDTGSSTAKDNENMKVDARVDGVFRIAKKHQLKFRVKGSYARNTYIRDYTEGDRFSRTQANEDFYSFDGQLAYLYQLDKKNAFYGRVTHFHNITSSVYGGDYESHQHLWKGETLFQLDYTHQFSDRLMLMLSPGASWLNYRLRGNRVQRSLNLRMNTAFRYVMNKRNWTGLGVSYGNNQPDISYLNTSTQTVDFYQIKRGNPFLDNTRIFTVFAMYEGALHKLLNVQCRASYQVNTHNVYAAYYLEDNKLVSSYASDDSYNKATVELALSSRISDNLRAQVGFNYDYMYVPQKSGLHRNNYFGTFDVNYFVGAFVINAFAHTSKHVLDQTTLAFLKVPANYGLSLRFSHKGWMAEVGTENPFSKRLSYDEYADYGVYRYSKEQTSRIFQQTGYVKLAYTFDFGRKTSRDKNNVDRSINSAILKVE